MPTKWQRSSTDSGRNAPGSPLRLMGLNSHSPRIGTDTMFLRLVSFFMTSWIRHHALAKSAGDPVLSLWGSWLKVTMTGLDSAA